MTEFLYSFGEESLEQRKLRYANIICKHPNHIPILCSIEMPDKKNKKMKFTVSGNSTFSHFQCILKSNIKLDAQDGLYMFINNKQPAAGDLIKHIHNLNANEDGFLYIRVCREATFGFG